ncbi:zinc finger MYM-type protein 1-like [Dendrobium catenatum]|uniref:zinc finger MYM-type protein 1-like n=1 Tax=Dendrobium catenatum TaxID=906689 RepID=UPI0009F57497|nr:zinc finger MYM-type protein 1-like [Dendrobium catenatum]
MEGGGGSYLFRKPGRGNEEEEAFNKNGFSNWKKTNKFDLHVGGQNSAHNNARHSAEDLLNQSQHIGFVFQKQTYQATSAYHIRLTTSVDCIRFLLKQGLAFQGHDESSTSKNQGNFLELVQFLAEHNKDIDDVVLKNAPDNLKLIAPDIQKDITRAFAIATTNFISEEIGLIVERFLGIYHVSDTTANSLKVATEQLLSTYAHYIHCFSHQLQLALVAVAKNHVHIALMFTIISSVMNLVAYSCKRHDQVREIQHEKTLKELKSGNLLSGQGLNQEITLRRAGDTRWGSHYESILRLITMFSIVIDVLEIILEEGLSSEQKDVLGITNELSKALQRGEQDIVNAMSLVRICKRRLQDMRDNKWTDFISNVIAFCEQQHINVPHMDDKWLQKLNNRFTEVNTDLLLCMACLNPNNRFHAFNKDKLIRMTQFYPADFSLLDQAVIENQLDTYIMDMRSDDQFTSLKDIGSLAEKMIQCRKDIVYHDWRSMDE